MMAKVKEFAACVIAMAVVLGLIFFLAFVFVVAFTNHFNERRETIRCFSIKTGITEGMKVQTKEMISQGVNPHPDIGTVIEVGPDGFVVEFIELGKKKVRFEEIEVFKVINAQPTPVEPGPPEVVK
jgi:hypothetical protein